MNQRLQHPTVTTLQNRAATMTALFMTVFLLCIEHVRAFANQYHLSAHDAMVLASAASSLSRRLGSSVKVQRIKKSINFLGGSFNRNDESSTRLNAWSIPAISLPSIPTLTSKDLPVHALGSWYSEVDPTNKLPVYDDEYENAYSFSSPTDDWPSIQDTNASTSQQQQPTIARRGPFKAIRRVAGRFVDGVIRFPHS